MFKKHLKNGLFLTLKSPFFGVKWGFKKITGWGGHPRSPARLTRPSASAGAGFACGNVGPRNISAMLIANRF
jgi:hypothetical protein